MQDANTGTSSQLGEAARVTNCKEKLSKGVGVHAHLCVGKGERESIPSREQAEVLAESIWGIRKSMQGGNCGEDN